MTDKQAIAERKLLFAVKGEENFKREATIRVMAPYPLEEGEVNFKFDPGTAGCTIEFDGLNEKNLTVHGIDSLHALAIAVDVDPILRGMQSKYSFYWSSGEPYFEAP